MKTISEMAEEAYPDHKDFDKIRAYTTIEQSRKLAEILPLESADMIYTMTNGYHTPFIRIETIQEMDKDDVCAWSLAALLGVLDFPSLTQRNENEWEVCIFDHDNDGYIEKIASNPVDACYEMILKLHELNLL